MADHTGMRYMIKLDLLDEEAATYRCSGSGFVNVEVDRKTFEFLGRPTTLRVTLTGDDS